MKPDDRLAGALWEADRHAAVLPDALAESFEDWPMRDRLERLEKLGYLMVDDWLRWRELRNRLAHEYPDQPELRFAVLKAAIGAAGELITAYARWKGQIGKS